MLEILERAAKSEEEGVRNIVGECLGHLILISPRLTKKEDHPVEPRLVSLLHAKSVNERATAATAVRFA